MDRPAFGADGEYGGPHGVTGLGGQRGQRGEGSCCLTGRSRADNLD